MGYVNKQCSRDFALLNEGLGDWYDDREEFGGRVVHAFIEENTTHRGMLLAVLERGIEAHVAVIVGR